MQEIDAVIAWVDGNDPDWIRAKDSYIEEHFSGGKTKNGGVNRYRDWKLLPFWFRAVEQFIPWVRRIHFVTWGHIPDFLNLDNKKLHVVRHEDFIPAQYLPTFSSRPIELNLHRIPGLSEKFVYFNDDMFLLKPLSPEIFFRKGLPCACGVEYPLVFYGKPDAWRHTLVNDLGIINKHFPKETSVSGNKRKYVNYRYRFLDNLRTLVLEKVMPYSFTGFRLVHNPAAYLKSTFAEVWEAEDALLDQTCQQRFRTCEDVNQELMRWWQIASGKFSPARQKNITDDITENTIAKLCDIIENRKYISICLNDPDTEIDFEKLQKRLKESFEKILPAKSSFEK